MTPVILMAIWKRHEVVKRNIELLSLQTKPFTLLVVYSDDQDGEFIYNLSYGYPFIKPILCENIPLGRKWQTGVYYSKSLNADPLIILGSDDFFNVDFVKNACELSQRVDFVGLTQWWAYDSIAKIIYKLRYVADFPLGGGRIYSNRLMERLEWKIFDSDKSRHLDDFAWELKDKTWLLIDETSPYGLQILSVKGKWEVMNPLDRLLNVPHILWTKVNSIDDIMGFKVKECLTL